MCSFYFVSAPCGSGKTYQIVKRAYELAKVGRRVIILQPTKKLIDKTLQNEFFRQPAQPTLTVFHGDTVAGSVARKLTEYLKQADDNGQIVFATHQVLHHINFWANHETWDVFIDEALQVHRHNSLRVPDTHKLITDLITLEPYNSIYGRVHVANESEIERIAKNKGRDEIYDAFRELSQTLLNRHWHSFVNTEQFEKLKAGKQEQLSVHSVLMPSVLDGFVSVVMAAANFRDSMIFRLWSAKRIQFREDTALASSLLFREHQKWAFDHDILCG
jgi:Rad3-related DNA helicase